jgi:hypothetical protein
MNPVHRGDFGMPTVMAQPATGDELALDDAFYARFEEEEEESEWNDADREGWDEEDDLDDEDEWDEDDDWDDEDDEWSEEEGWDDEEEGDEEF